MRLIFFIKLFIKSIDFKNQPIENYINLSYIVKSKIFRKKRKILVASMPKSGSTFISKVLASATDSIYCSLVFDLKQNEQDIYLPKLIDYFNVPLVIHQHCRATIKNIELIEKYGLTPIVLVRNIYDSVLSIKEHIERESKNWSMIYINSNYQCLSDDERIDFIIDNYVPWVFYFFVSWNDYSISSQGKSPVLFVKYEDMINNKVDFIERILTYLNIKALDIQKIIAEYDNTPKEVRFNKGVSGRGEQHLSEDQKKRIKVLSDYYRNVDFSILGINKQK